MNLELLEEIHELQKRDISDTEIANSLGMSKANMLLALRMEKIISNKYKQELEEKNNLNDINISLKIELSKKDKEIKYLKFSGANDYIEEIDNLKYELEKRDDYSRQYHKLKSMYDDIPNFIKRLF